MSIDIHTHILPEKIPNWFQKFGYGEFIHLEHSANCCAKMIKGDKVFREIEPNCWDTSVRIKEMDATNVDKQVLSTIPVLFNYWAKPEHGYETSRFFNDHLCNCQTLHPERFISIGTVPLQDIDLAIKEMERCVKELKMPGLEIGSNVNQLNLSDPYFHPFWEAAQELDCALFIHPWEMMGENEMMKYWLPWLVGMPAETARAICSFIFGGIFEKFPSLRVAFAHGGGSFPFTVGRVAHGHAVRPDLCAIDNQKSPLDYLGKFWIDALVHDKDALKYVIKVMGKEKVCMGSDYPFPLGEQEPGKLIADCHFDQDINQLLLVDNAKKWLGIQ